jgi:tetratricopeptide (TPR) repeat protein
MEIMNGNLDRGEALLGKVKDDFGGEKDYLWGVIHANRKEYDNAEKCFNRTISQNEKHIGAYLSLSELYNIQEKYDDAKDILERVYKIDPENINVLSYLAGLNMYLKKYDDAIKLFRAIQSKDEKLKNDEQIKKLFIKALEGKAETDIRDGKFDDLEHYAREIIEIDNDYAGGYKLMGIIHLNNSDYKKASEYFIRAFQGLSSDVNIANLLTQSLIGMNDFENARVSNDYALKIDPDNQQATKFKDMLDND